MASEAARAAEAILMVADEPVEPQLLAQLLELSPGRVEELCGELAAAYEAEDRGVVAYKQPVSRAQVAVIRGVNADAVMRTLCQRGYVEEVGRDPGPGQAVLYGTSRMFLERLGVDSLADLPPLGDFVPGPEVVEALERGLGADDT